MRSFLRKIYHPFYEFYLNIEECIVWLPVIWKDRWWDGVFLMKIMELKLKRDAKGYEKWGIAVPAPRYAQKMRLAAALLHRLQEDDYTTPWDKEYQKYLHPWWDYLMEHGTTDGFSYTKRDSDLSHWVHQRKDELKNQDKKLLLKLLDKYILEAWD